jgi:hypothetical protein
MDLTDDPLAGVDASELEADIDKAIDELFVKKTEGQEPSRVEEVPPEEPAEKPLEKPAEEPVPASPAEAADDSLAQLKESLLTLDWEITPESIQDFEKELQAVSDKHGEDRHCMAVIKMSLGVLTYLRAAQADAAPISVQFLHGATRGLDLFVREPAPTEAERSEVMDTLLGQFRRVKAEIQRMKPPAEQPPAVAPEAVVEPPPVEEPILEEMVEEEPALEEIVEEEPVLEEPFEEAPPLEEIIEEEPILEELAAEQPVEAVPPEEEPDLDELFGEEPILEEGLEEEPTLVAPSEEEADLEEIIEEEPILEELAAEQPVEAVPPEEEPDLDELFGEEPILEEPPEEEPTLVAPSEEEADLDELFGEESLLEEGLEEEPTLAALPEEEPILEEPPEEEPTLEAHTAAEPTLAAPFEEEPILEELFEEELVAEELPEAEPTLEPPPGEEPVFEELFDEELALEPAEMAPSPEMVPADTVASPQPFIQEARALSGQLFNALEVLGQETTTFFDRILKAMAGKPALEKLERHFDTVHKTVGAQLTEAQELSGNLSAALSKLEQNIGQQQEGTFSPDAQAAIDSQVKTIRNAVHSLSQATASLQDSLAGKGVAPMSSHEGIAFKDAQLGTEEFMAESDEFMESLDSEPVLDLLEEVPSESPGITPDAQASIYLADVVNNTLGIPAEAVVNIFKVSKGKAKGLRKRGYARLADFKGAFRSIKRGITGPLANLKPKDLKKIQFPIIALGPETLGGDDTEAVAPVRGIVLLSTGERHGALLTDEVMQRTPYDVKGYRKAGLPGEVSGMATIEGDFEINVIDPNYVLS